MIPTLIIDKDFIEKNWDTPESREETLKIVQTCVKLKDANFPVYMFNDFWAKMGVFKNFKGFEKRLLDYGYADTEESLVKYLQKYADDNENNYFIEVSLLSMDNEKYYKFGSYINKDGINTQDDYYYYIDEHPEMEVEQDYENQWIHFTVNKLKDSEK